MKPLDRRTNGNCNLLLLAAVLDDAERRDAPYDQTTWFHACGTPACAIGHWLAYKSHHGHWVSAEKIAALQVEFDVDDEGWGHLFGYRPGYPKSAGAAADRIRAFVDARASVNGETAR